MKIIVPQKQICVSGVIVLRNLGSLMVRRIALRGYECGWVVHHQVKGTQWDIYFLFVLAVSYCNVQIGRALVSPAGEIVGSNLWLSQTNDL